jgi:hypothetical protein
MPRLALYCHWMNEVILVSSVLPLHSFGGHLLGVFSREETLAVVVPALVDAQKIACRCSSIWLISGEALRSADCLSCSEPHDKNNQASIAWAWLARFTVWISCPRDHDPDSTSLDIPTSIPLPLFCPFLADFHVQIANACTYVCVCRRVARTGHFWRRCFEEVQIVEGLNEDIIFFARVR